MSALPAFEGKHTLALSTQIPPQPPHPASTTSSTPPKHPVQVPMTRKDGTSPKKIQTLPRLSRPDADVADPRSA